MPDAFMRATIEAELPQAGHYAAGMAFLDRDIAKCARQEQQIAGIVREEGLEVLSWRTVPTNPDGLGLQALATMPSFKTLVIADPEAQLSGVGLDRKTFRIRKRVEHEVGIYFASLSSRTFVYKGMLTTMQLTDFFPVLDEHLPQLAAGPAFQTDSPQWRDQHHSGQPQLAFGKRGQTQLGTAWGIQAPAADRHTRPFGFRHVR